MFGVLTLDMISLCDVWEDSTILRTHALLVILGCSTQIWRVDCLVSIFAAETLESSLLDGSSSAKIDGVV